MEKTYATIESILSFECPFCGTLNKMDVDHLDNPEIVNCEECDEVVELEIENLSY